MSITIFPARAAIGTAQVAGQTMLVMMTPEFSRALAAVADDLEALRTEASALRAQLVALGVIPG